MALVHGDASQVLLQVVASTGATPILHLQLPHLSCIWRCHTYVASTGATPMP